MAEPFAIIPKSELSCSVCSKLFVEPYNPKDLPDCHHVCCEVCLVGYVRETDLNQKLVICPECKIESEIGDGGIQAMKTNVRLRNLAEKQEAYTALKIKNRLEFDTEICDACLKHPSENMLFYCVSCAEPICQRCLVPEHLNHVVKEQAVIIKAQSAQMAEQIKTGNQELSLCQDQMEEIGKHENGVQKYMEEAQKCIKKSSGYVYAKIREVEKGFMERLKRYESQQDYKEKLTKDIEVLERKLNDFAAMQAFFEQQKDDDELLDNYRDILTWLGDLSSVHTVSSFSMDTPNIPLFVPYSVSSSPPNLGRITIKDHLYDETQISAVTDDGYDTICDGHWEISCESSTTEDGNRSAEVKPISRERLSSHSYESYTIRNCENSTEVQPISRERLQSHSYEWTIINPNEGIESANEASCAKETPSPFQSSVKSGSKRKHAMSEHTDATTTKHTSNVHLQLIGEFGNFTDVTAIATGNGVIAACDPQKLQTSIWKKHGEQYKIMARIRSSQPRDVAVLPNGAIVIANGSYAELHSPSSAIYETIDRLKSSLEMQNERPSSDLETSWELCSEATSNLAVKSKLNKSDYNVDTVGSFAFRRRVTSQSMCEIPSTAQDKHEERWYKRLSKRNSTGSRDVLSFSAMNYSKSVIHSTKNGCKDKKLLRDIQSVVVTPDNHLLLGDTVRQVITRHTTSGSLQETIKVVIKPYIMDVVNSKRIVISDYDKILIQDLNGGSKIVTYNAHVYGLCYTPLIRDGMLFVNRRKRLSSIRGYRTNKGTLDGYELNASNGSDVSKCDANLIGQMLGGLFKPGGIVMMQDNTLAIADKKTVKIYTIL